MKSQTISAGTEGEKDRRIREAQGEVIARMTADPAAALSTLRTEGRIGEGLACTVRQGDWSATVDFGPEMGGDSKGPSPGFFARASISGCVAMAIKMLAAREGIRLAAVDVAVEMDFDDSALFGLGAQSAAPLATRIEISVEADVGRAVIDDLVARALAMDPYYLALRDPQSVSHSVRLRRAD